MGFMLVKSLYRSMVLFFFVLCFEVPCYSQNLNPSIYVWAPDSCTIYKHPSLESTPISRLAYGDSLLFVQKEALSTSPLFLLSELFEQDTVQYARWLKVIVKNEIGYVLENQVSELKPFQKNQYCFEPLHTYLKREYGLIDSLNFKRDISIGSSTFNVTIDSLSFLNESTFTTAYNDGCENYKYEFKNISLLNAYFLLNLDVYYDEVYINLDTDQSEHAIYSLKLENVEQNTYFFKDLFSQNGLKIIVHSNRVISLEYYYCM